MRSRLLLPALLLCFAGCGGKPAAEAPKSAAPAAQPQKDAARALTLDARAQREAGVTVEKVMVRSLPQTVRSNGRLTTNDLVTWRVGAVTDGRIIKVLAKVGDAVEKGAVLARMHSHDIHEARSLYRKAQTDLTRASGQEAFARRNRDRLKRLFDLKAASFEQVDNAETELKNSSATRANAQEELQRTRAHLVEFLDLPAEAEHEYHPGGDFDDADLIPIKSPARGVVVERTVNLGAVVTAASDLFVVCDLSSLWAIAAVQEDQLPRIRAGMPARVSVQAYPGRVFRGKISRINETLDAATRTAAVRVELDNQQALLKPEMYASIELEVGGSEPALLAPQTAVQDVNGQSVVFVRTAPDKFEVRSVDLGGAMEGLVVVRGGLLPGDELVTRGSFILKSQLLKASLAEE